jgi:chromosome segregation ATPase
MKFKFFTVATVVAFFIASCGGVDKGLVDNITKFQTDWEAMSKDASSMSDKMTTSASESMKECDEACAKMCKDKKLQPSMDSIKRECEMPKETMNKAIENLGKYKEDIAKMTADFMAWKDKVMKGEVKTDEATKALDEYKAKMTEVKDQLKAFQDNFDMGKSDMASLCKGADDCCEKE